MNTTWAISADGWSRADAISGRANSSTQTNTKTYTAYAMASDGTSAARALPTSSSSWRIGVVRTGSRVSCCRSPTIEYAATRAGTMAGMPSM